MQGGPLAGIRVIDLTTVVLGPFATQLLGDMGADVIKVESPDGDNCRWIGPSRTTGMGSYFAMLNRNKRSVVLDLKRPAAKDALMRLVDGADVFVHNMRLGAAERLGLGYASLAARNPRLIHACASGFRKGSSKQEHPAFDDMIQGMSGLAALNAGPDGAPRYVPTRDGGQADRADAGVDDRHGAVPPRTHRAGSGSACADAGDDAVLPAGRASVGRGDQRAGTGPWLSAHADAASAAVRDEGWLHLR